MIIVEGRKEDVAKRLKQKFEYDSPFIDRILSIDPTGYKYVDYIGKQLEKIITQLAGSKGGLNTRQQDAILDIMGLVIPWFHNNVNRITEDDIWNAETIFRDRNGMVPNIEGISKSYKDINQYENPEFIRTLMGIVDGKKSEREKERELKSQAEKLYEDDEVLVIRPKSHAASCYYGANTKWCTAGSGSSGYFDRYNNRGMLYYFIDKVKNVKYALYRNTETKDSEVYNAKDIEVGVEELREVFPNQNELIDDLTGAGDFVKALREFSRGKITARELEDSDDLILQVKPSNILGQSRIIFDFGSDEKFFKSLDISEDDQWFLAGIMSNYGGFDFYDSYTIENDFKEGYIIYYDLNEENKEKLKRISSIILPDREFNLENEEYKTDLSNLLLNLFERETDYILDEYLSLRNSEMVTTARESIESEIDAFLESIGFDVARAYDEIGTTPANLVMWSVRLGLPKTDAKSLFNQIVRSVGTNSLGGWAENSYNYYDPKNFDSETFNNEVSRQFDDILESLEDDDESGGEKLKEFLNFRVEVITNFELNKWNRLPSDKNVRFKVNGFDRENNKIKIVIEKEDKGMRNLKLSRDNFNNLLYQPQLFDLFEV